MSIIIEEKPESGELDEVHAKLAAQAMSSRNLTIAEVKTDQSGRAAIAETDLPHSQDRIDPAEITEVPPIAERVLEAAHDAGIAEEKNSDPNLTLMAIMAGLAYEKKAMGQLASHEGKTKQNLENIDTLLDLSSTTTNLGDKETYELSEEMQGLLAKLRGHGINLLKEGTKTISKEQLIQLKSEIGARVDKARTEVQQIFTKIQSIIQFMNSVNDTCKRITSEDSRSKNKFIENQKVR